MLYSHYIVDHRYSVGPVLKNELLFIDASRNEHVGVGVLDKRHSDYQEKTNMQLSLTRIIGGNRFQPWS